MYISVPTPDSAASSTNIPIFGNLGPEGNGELTNGSDPGDSAASSTGIPIFGNLGSDGGQTENSDPGVVTSTGFRSSHYLN